MSNERAGWFGVYFAITILVLGVALCIAHRDLALARAELSAWRHACGDGAP